MCDGRRFQADGAATEKELLKSWRLNLGFGWILKTYHRTLSPHLFVLCIRTVYNYITVPWRRYAVSECCSFKSNSNEESLLKLSIWFWHDISR